MGKNLDIAYSIDNLEQLMAQNEMVDEMVVTPYF